MNTNYYSKLSGVITSLSPAILLLILLLLLFNQHVTSQEIPDYKLGELIYENPLAEEADLKNAVIESSEENQPTISFDNGRMKLASNVHFLLWFPMDFPGDIAVTWEFMPKVDAGLAMFWFCAKGKEGKDLFDESLQKRSGNYPQYHSGDINAYHVSYYRRNAWDDPTINTVNLRKSYGKNLVEIGPNPIPNIEVEKVAQNLKEPYRIKVIRYGGHIHMEINDLPVLDWLDEEPYQGGKIGFRQMADLVAEYSNLKVYEVVSTGK